MLLRVEDTDASLKTQAFVDAITEPLRWLGLDWDSGPYFQSERRSLHEAAIKQLVANGAAYYCDLTREQIGAEGRRGRAAGRLPRLVPRPRCERRTGCGGSVSAVPTTAPRWWTTSCGAV